MKNEIISKYQNEDIKENYLQEKKERLLIFL